MRHGGQLVVKRLTGLAVGQAELREVALGVFAYKNFNAYLAVGVDGAVGAELLRNQRVLLGNFVFAGVEFCVVNLCFSH